MMGEDEAVGEERTREAPGGAATGDPEPDEDEFPGLDGLVGTFMREPSLWPVLIVVLGSVGAFGAALIVLSTVDRNPFAAGALLLIGGMTADLALRARKSPALRNLARLVGLLWLASLLLAGVAWWTGLATP